MSRINQMTAKTTKKITSNCGDCELCTETIAGRRVRIASDDVLAIENIIQSHNPTTKGQCIYQTGQPFKHLYTVHSGMFKSVHLTPQGEERILEVFIPGQVMGFDGIRDGQYQTTVTALSDGSICTIPFEQLNRLAHQYQAIQNRLLKMMSEKILQFEMAQNENNAEQKVIQFVFTVSDLYHSRGFSAVQFPFPISQRDWANYLGLAEETLSRTLARFRKQELMVIKDKQITLIDKTALEQRLDGAAGQTH